MTNGRPPKYSDLCCVEDIEERKQHRTTIEPRIRTTIIPGKLLWLWNKDIDTQYIYQGRLIYGIQITREGYELVLAGLDAPILVTPETSLELL